MLQTSALCTAVLVGFVVAAAATAAWCILEAFFVSKTTYLRLISLYSFATAACIVPFSRKRNTICSLRTYLTPHQHQPHPGRRDEIRPVGALRSVRPEE